MCLTSCWCFSTTVLPSKTSSSMNTPTIFFPEYKWSTCFEDVCLKKLLSGFLFCLIGCFFTKRILKVFIANSIKYLSVYRSKYRTDTWSHSFSPKFSTCPWRLQNSEVFNNCQDCQRYSVWKRDVIMALQAEKIKVSYRTSSKFISRAA